MQVIPTRRFKADTDFYIRKKKYFKIIDDIKIVTDELANGNLIGDRLQDIKISEGCGVQSQSCKFFCRQRQIERFQTYLLRGD